MRRALSLCAFSLLLIEGWFFLNDGFRMGKILHGYPLNYTWEEVLSGFGPDDDKRQIQEILNQEYVYLGKGQQCYVFESSDQKYVIKFFRTHKERFPFWVYLPGMKERKKKEIAWKRSRIERNSQSYVIARSLLKEETALIYLHLKESNDLKQTMRIRDKIGRSFNVDLDQMEFIVQKKMTPLLPLLEANKNNAAYIENIIDLVFDWTSMRIKKGVRNKNRRCLKNLGMLAGKVIEYDVGEFRINPELSEIEAQKIEIYKSTKNMRQWLEKNAPSTLSYFDAKLFSYEK